MTPTLSNELQHALDQSGGQPLRIEDPRTRKAYVLVEWDVARNWMETRRTADGDWSGTKNARRCELIHNNARTADRLNVASPISLGMARNKRFMMESQVH